MVLPKSFDLEEKVAVISGGAGILCSEIAEALGECGAKVAILDISEEGMKSVSESLSDRDIEHITINTNVTDRESIGKAAKKTIKNFGKVDILINGAGGNKAEATTSAELSFFDLPEAAVRSVFNLNFMSTFLTSQVFGEFLANQGEGVILNISSMNAFVPLTNIPAYSAAKAAISNFTMWLATHMSQNYSTKIRVNAIAPGFFLTEQNRYLLIDKNTGTLTERGKAILEHTPMKRFGEPKDLISTVLWLVSPGSEFITGSVIPIDGGFSAFSGV
jgi:NAD(P)-dependent dehydrogenase (short-subunit alcohol dehydrogenase family)